ncbi:zinc carboxypeptidase [bacterium]|nr:zinc carboxypeptidase [bacterium]
MTFRRRGLAAVFVLAILTFAPAAWAGFDAAGFDTIVDLEIYAPTIDEREIVANLGAAIERVDDTGWIVVELPAPLMARLTELGLPYRESRLRDAMPGAYDAYHNFDEQVARIESIANTYPSLTQLFSIGQTHEGRELWALKISDNAMADESMDEPAFVLVALHHAREILSPEVALHFASGLVELYGQDEMITALVDTREIFVLPNLNPDGGEFDHEGGNFHLWRKNRRVNDDVPEFCWGVDLNRNYGHEWGHSYGASGNPCMLTYYGPAPFSEPETAAFRDFLVDNDHTRVVISLHTYSELILWPYGYTFDPVEGAGDAAVFEALGVHMAGQNGYTPQQASDLYRTSGDLLDWAYAERDIFGYTFELSPASPFGGNFYPPASIIDPTNEANFNALLLALGMSRDPRLSVSTDLWKLAAVADGNAVLVNWASVVETNAAGWNVYRRLAGSFDETRINGDLIPAGQPQYAQLDANVEDGEYVYIVEFVSNDPAHNVRFEVDATVDPADSGTDDDMDDDADDDDAAGDDDASDDDAAGNDDDAATGDDDDDDGGCGC